MKPTCTCATFEKPDGSVWTMIRDPKCELHGDDVGENLSVTDRPTL